MKQKKPAASIGLSLATCAMLVALLSGCDSNDGPAEQAGKKLDNALEETGKQMEKAGETVKDAVKDE